MRKYIRICLWLCFPVIIWSQEPQKTIEVTYVKAYKNYKDTTDAPPKIIKDIEYKLICDKNKSRFEITKKPFLVEYVEELGERVISRGGGNGFYYKNIAEKVKMHQVESVIDGKELLIELPFNEYQWVITKEQKEILGYSCYKAFTEYEYEAPDHTGTKMTPYKVRIEVWYAPELSYPFGPAGHDGLPGLVLEKYSSSFYFIASKIDFKNSEAEIIKPKYGIKITKEEYSNQIKDMYKEYFPDLN